MTERTKKILYKSVKDFIETGRPITSGRLYKKYNFGIKPAMIRRELSELHDEGFLKQLHTSGGRYPTNKAYRYLVDTILENDVRSRTHQYKRLGIIDDFLSGERRMFTRELAEYLEALSVMYEPSRNEFYNSGLKKLFNSIEFENKNEMSGIVEDFEELERRLTQQRKWWERQREWPQVFIGKSPITESQNLAVVAQRVSISKDGNNRVLLLAIGPRRMDYRKPIGLFKYLEENIT